jgi:hypothetical protein
VIVAPAWQRAFGPISRSRQLGMTMSIRPGARAAVSSQAATGIGAS